MSKHVCFLSVLLVLLICLCSCSSTRTIETNVPYLGSYEDDDVAITAQIVKKSGTVSYVELTVKNKSQSLISLDLDKSTYNLLTVGSQRLVDGETRVINSNLPQATIPIAPNTTATRHLFTSDGLIVSIESSLYITVLVEGKEVGYTINLKPGNLSDAIVGRVAIEGKLRGSVYSHKIDDIKDALLKEAQRLYGYDVQVININYELKRGAIGMASAILTYGLYSSQSYTATADVVRWK